MSRAHLYRSATDSAGNVVPNVQVSVYRAGSTTLLDQSLYTGNVGSTTLPNPFVTSNGIIEFYLDTSQSVKIGLTVGNSSQMIDNIEVTPAPENLVQAAEGFSITNTPITGQFLQATAPGQASWVSSSDLISTKASQLSGLRSYDFSTSSLSDLTIQDAVGQPVTPTYADTTLDTLPPGYTFTKALRLPITVGETVARMPVLNFPESGSVTFLYKIVSPDTNPATLRVAVDSGSLRMQVSSDPSLANIWVVGYLSDIPTGMHSIRFEHVPGLSPNSYVLLGNVVVQYGNNIPFHTHQGHGVGSTMLGPNATADFDRSTVVGGNATSTDVAATVYGFQASGAIEATAIGAYSQATKNGVAVGYYSTNQAATEGGVSVGYTAQTLADNGVAVGSYAQAAGARGVAVGTTAHATGVESVALGPNATASGPGSVALGSGSSVGSSHARSLALGAGSATTAADQLMLGTSATSTVVPGSLDVDGTATIGSANSVVGIFGSAGTTRPTITGSRGGNPSVAQLLSALDALGIISDGSTP